MRSDSLAVLSVALKLSWRSLTRCFSPPQFASDPTPLLVLAREPETSSRSRSSPSSASSLVDPRDDPLDHVDQLVGGAVLAHQRPQLRGDPPEIAERLIEAAAGPARVREREQVAVRV